MISEFLYVTTEYISLDILGLFHETVSKLGKSSKCMKVVRSSIDPTTYTTFYHTNDLLSASFKLSGNAVSIIAKARIHTLIDKHVHMHGRRTTGKGMLFIIPR